MRNLLLFGSVLSFIAFCSVSFIAAHGGLVRFDFDTTVLLQSRIPVFFDEFLSAFSLIGSFEVMTILLVLTLAFYRRIRGIVVFVLYGVGMLIEVLGKLFIYHPGPPHIFFRYDLSFLFPSAYVSTHYSFPSGHAMRATYLTLFLIGLIYSSRHLHSYTKWGGSVLLSCALAIMLVSRVSLGEHWASDVAAGAFLGAGLSGIAITAIPKLLTHRR